MTGTATRRAEARPTPGRRAAPWWLAPLAIFAGSRLLTTALFVWVQSQATIRSRAGAHPSLLDLATTWDGTWYWLIGLRGYPSVLPTTESGAVDTNQWAFLPVYPFLARVLGAGVVDWRIVAVAISVAAGFASAVLLLVLLQPHVGRSRGLFAVALFSCSPLAFLLQTAYAESLGIALLLAALVLVERHRYGAAIPVALVLAFTRPGVLALALAVALHLVVRVVAGRRQGAAPPQGELLRGVLLAGVCAIAGFGWTAVAAAVTGRPDAYVATEGAWRALWMPEGSFTLFEPWAFAAAFWARQVAGAAAAVWVAPLALAVLIVGFALLLLAPPVRRLGPTLRLWLASYALYLLAVFFPQSSVFRLLMPMAPLTGVLVPARAPARAAVLGVSIALQALWLWATFGPVQDYWTVP